MEEPILHARRDSRAVERMRRLSPEDRVLLALGLTETTLLLSAAGREARRKADRPTSS